MTISKIRNIGIVAHIDAGKTTTSERILYLCGKIHKLGEVDQGSATMDWMVQEQERGITITAAATSCKWQRSGSDFHLNLVDTPGHVDFTLEVERSLRVMDGAVVIICAVAGVQPQTETVWQQANKFKVPRLVFVNKLDRTGADFDAALVSVRAQLGARLLALNIPFIEDNKFSGVIDLIAQQLVIYDQADPSKPREIKEIPEKYTALAAEKRQLLVDCAAEFDDELLAAAIESDQIPPALILNGLKKAVNQGDLVLALAGAAANNQGVHELLDAMVDFLPAPDKAAKTPAYDEKGDKQLISCDKNLPPLALLFKLQLDPFAGMLAFLKVYAGEISVGKTYWNASRKKRERVLKLFRIHSAKKEAVKTVSAGDIAAAVGLNSALSGDTLSPQGLLLEAIATPQAVISVAIELGSAADNNKMEQYLARLVREDPSLKVSKDESSGQTILSGMGELHLEVALERMRQEAKFNFNIGKQQVSARETVTKQAHCQQVFDKPLMGKNSLAELKIALSPRVSEDDENEILILSDLKDYPELVAMLKQGGEEGLSSGVLAGNPLIKTELRISEVKIDPEAYQPAAFKIAATLGIRRCLLAAECRLMGPQMKVNVIAPTEFLGAVINDLNQRRAKILTIKDQGPKQEIVSLALLEKMLGYATELRSMTSGKGSFNMQFHSFSLL